MVRGIYKRPGKKCTKWTTFVDLPPDPVTGRRRQKRITADSVREVERQVVALRHSMDTSQYVDPSKINTRDFLGRWLNSIDRLVKPSTQRRYSDLIRLHVVPIIGHRPLTKLTPLDIQELYANRLSSGLSPSTVAMTHNVLHRALKQAMRWGMDLRNVAEAVDPSKEAVTEYRI